MATALRRAAQTRKPSSMTPSSAGRFISTTIERPSPSLSVSGAVSIPTFRGRGATCERSMPSSRRTSPGLGPVHADLNADLDVWRIDGSPLVEEAVALALTANMPPPFGVMGEAYYFSDAAPVAPRDGWLPLCFHPLAAIVGSSSTSAPTWVVSERQGVQPLHGRIRHPRDSLARCCERHRPTRVAATCAWRDHVRFKTTPGGSWTGRGRGSLIDATRGRGSSRTCERAHRRAFEGQVHPGQGPRDRRDGDRLRGHPPPKGVRRQGPSRRALDAIRHAHALLARRVPGQSREPPGRGRRARRRHRGRRRRVPRHGAPGWPQRGGPGERQRCRLPLALVAGFGLQLLDVLVAAHARGPIHRASSRRT